MISTFFTTQVGRSDVQSTPAPCSKFDPLLWHSSSGLYLDHKLLKHSLLRMFPIYHTHSDICIIVVKVDSEINCCNTY